MPNSWSRAFRIVPFLLAATLPLGAADPEFPSGWRSAEVTVDGSAEEWAGRLVPIPETQLLLGVQNDGSFLYVCLKTSDEATRRRILALGFNFYFDTSGKADRAFGIRFPASPEPPPRPADGAAPEGGPPRTRQSASPYELEILGRGEADAGRMTVAQARPVAAALSETDGVLVVEIKVPLAFSIETPFAVQSGPGKTMALGLESARTAAPKSDKGRGNREGGGREGGTRIGGGMGGRGGFGSGGGGYRPGYGGTLGGEGSESRRGEGRSSDRPDEKSLGKPIKAWFRVPLATGPSLAPSPGPTQAAPR